MLDTVQIRKRGALDFEAYYDHACALQDTVPVPVIKAHLRQDVLDFNGDRIKLVDWTPILQSLAINKHLRHVAVRSCYQTTIGESTDRFIPSFRKRIPAFRSKDMTFRLCKAIRECLHVSPCLHTLQLHGLPLRPRDLIALTKGIAKSTCLESLSLAYCPIGDEGLEAICQSVKYSSTIKTVDFTGCNLTWRAAEHMAKIVKHQAMRRHSVAWAESLRYRKPELERMSGLRRITLSCNTLIGDRGAAVLAQELAEDLWVKALDLQKCGLSNEGANAMLEMLRSNTTVSVLDIRRNPLVDNGLIKAVIERVLLNTNGNFSEYAWIKPPSTKDARNLTTQRQNRISVNGGRGRGTFRIGSRGMSVSNGKSPCLSRTSAPGSNGHVPWRTAARAGRQRGLPESPVIAGNPFQGASTVKVTMETESESEEVEGLQLTPPTLGPQKITMQQYKHLQVELEECHLRLDEEKKARVKADVRVIELELENKRLRNINLSLTEAVRSQPMTSSALEDEAVLESIETSFKKFHAFLDLLKDAGLGQLASIAGISQTDFGPLNRQSVTSTDMPGGGENATERTGASIQGPSEQQPRLLDVGGQQPAAVPGEHSFTAHFDPTSSWPDAITEATGQQRVPSPVWHAAQVALHSGNHSHGNSSHGNSSHGNDSLKETSLQSSPSKKSESLGSRASGREKHRSVLTDSEEGLFTRSELLEQIHSFGSL